MKYLNNRKQFKSINESKIDMKLAKALVNMWRDTLNYIEEEAISIVDDLLNDQFTKVEKVSGSKYKVTRPGAAGVISTTTYDISTGTAEEIDHKDVSTVKGVEIGEEDVSKNTNY